VIGALSPSTNPEATPVIKAISAIKGRNSIIIAPHPRAQKTNALIINLMRDAIVKMGAPADLVIGVDNPSVEKTVELMRQSDRILATGGPAMVKAAYSSGTSLNLCASEPLFLSLSLVYLLSFSVSLSVPSSL
jgi:sulfoacetaldehyde dehydrogenase